MSSRRIIGLTGLEAKKYFQKDRSYINFEVPPYFHFDELLLFSAAAIGKRQLNSICKKGSNKKPLSPKNFEGVNYTVLTNKDGAYSWRPLQLIHPVLYIDLINTICESSNWAEIQARFKEFSKGYVRCISIPRESLTDDSDTATQVADWWENIEQESLKKSLEYDYIFSTDITDCYGSIYTHSVEWALHTKGKNGVKEERKAGESPRSVGKIIDEKLRNMNNGQTNGIPQGSKLMDFIAEIILGYADLDLTKRLKQLKIDETKFHILRYRDDYRILTNEPSLGHEILKQLNLVLIELGLKMHPGKTTESGDVIISSLKAEKVEAIYIAPIQQYFQKEALRIYQISKKYPNSGLVMKELSDFYDRVSDTKVMKKVNYEVLVAIITMVSIQSPRTINWTAAINSKIIERINNKERQIDLTKKVIAKFMELPNVGLIDLWLQRISAPLGVNAKYKDRLTEAALSKVKNSELWNCDWLTDDIKEAMDLATISDLSYKLKFAEITPTIEREEVELFRTNYPW
jgi:RNA-directed DNA polymerase